MPSTEAGYGATIKELRSKLGLTQEAFAAAYNIPVESLKNWEQEKHKPNSAEAPYLTVIAKYPLVVRGVLAKMQLTESPVG